MPGYLPRKAKTENWCTPPEILVPVRKVFRGIIDLDPCGNPWSIVKAEEQVWLPKWKRYLKKHTDVVIGDGLEVPWLGNIFFNPPYHSKALKGFFERAARSAGCGAGNSIGFAQVKTDIAAWHMWASRAQAICLIKGRVSHLLPNGLAAAPAPFPQALVLWSGNREVVHRFALELDGKLGQVMVPA